MRVDREGLKALSWAAAEQACSRPSAAQRPGAGTQQPHSPALLTLAWSTIETFEETPFFFSLYRHISLVHVFLLIALAYSNCTVAS